MKAPCARCGRIHSRSDVRAVGRFRPDGPLTFGGDVA